MNAPFWTPARTAELCERYGSGETLDAIAASWGVTRGAVIGKWNRLKATCTLDEQHIAALCELMAIDVSLDDCASALSLPLDTILATVALIRRSFGEQGA